MWDNSLGEALHVTLFGQSHAPAVGCVIEGYPAGRTIDWDMVSAFMAKRAPGQNAWSTPRKEDDAPEILSGLNEQGKTCGAPITALIRNSNVKSKDYEALRQTPRPGHADFAAWKKWGDAWDIRGGGQFSARLTAPLCFAGALAMQYLRDRGIQVGAHIARIGSVQDAEPDLLSPALPFFAPGAFPAIDPEKGEQMKKEIEAARLSQDSVGGEIRCFLLNLPAGLGGPLFAGLEGRFAQALFGIPAVKGVSFGAGFDAARMRGSENNDPYRMIGGKPVPASNRHGGILGGISTGAPLYFTVAFKPTPSIAQPQQTVNLTSFEDATLAVQGRHDPCVVPRAVPVVEAVAALVAADLLLQGGNV